MGPFEAVDGLVEDSDEDEVECVDDMADEGRRSGRSGVAVLLRGLGLETGICGLDAAEEAVGVEYAPFGLTTVGVEYGG